MTFLLYRANFTKLKSQEWLKYNKELQITNSIQSRQEHLWLFNSRFLTEILPKMVEMHLSEPAQQPSWLGEGGHRWWLLLLLCSSLAVSLCLSAHLARSPHLLRCDTDSRFTPAPFHSFHLTLSPRRPALPLQPPPVHPRCCQGYRGAFVYPVAR